MDLDIHGCVLKSRSPSCGIDDVEVHCHDGQIKRNGIGFFSKILHELIPKIPVTDERRLLDPELREQWLATVLANA